MLACRTKIESMREKMKNLQRFPVDFEMRFINSITYERSYQVTCFSWLEVYRSKRIENKEGMNLVFVYGVDGRYQKRSRLL